MLNDIRSMIAANNTASRKLAEIVDEFGLEGHRAYCEINKDLSEQVLRERIDLLPDGVYEAVDWNEFDGHDGPDQLLEMRCRLEVDGTDMRFHYSGVPQIDAFVNSTEGPMFGQAMTAMMTSLVYGDLPINGGLWRPITVELGEPGTIVNSIPPAPVSNAHSEVGMRACKLAKAVLNQALSLSPDPTLRGRVAGQCQDGFPGSALFGANQHGGTSVIFYVDNASGSGGGAQTIGDGQDSYGLTCMTGCGLADVEVHEAADPVMFLWRKLIANSGGPGQMRGGQALEQAFAIRFSDAMGGPGFNACAEVPPIGFGGGYPASSGDFQPLSNTNISALIESGDQPTEERIQGTKVPTRSKMTHLVLARDDVFVTTRVAAAASATRCCATARWWRWTSRPATSLPPTPARCTASRSVPTARSTRPPATGCGRRSAVAGSAGRRPAPRWARPRTSASRSCATARTGPAPPAARRWATRRQLAPGRGGARGDLDHRALRRAGDERPGAARDAGRQRPRVRLQRVRGEPRRGGGRRRAGADRGAEAARRRRRRGLRAPP